MIDTDTALISKKNILAGFDSALANYKIAALTKRDQRDVYDFIDHSSQIEFTYKPTVLPPKKFFFPQREDLLEYDANGKITTKIEAKPMILFGIRPCDINALKMMHEAFAEGHGDPNYLAKAEKAIIIGMDCYKVCDEHAFCYLLGTNTAHTGYDIMLRELKNDTFVIEIATDKGRKFIKEYWQTTPANGKELTKFNAKKKRNIGRKKPLKNLAKLPELFEKNRQHPIWEKEGSRCLSCGSCVMVCPTCYCFNVRHEWKLNFQKGTSSREWGACMLSSFATIASGENFRPTPTERLKHRMQRKFNYLMTKHDMPVCVGCGRCVRACLADISPKTILEAIAGKK